MSNFNYSLNNGDYTWENALLWGNFREHCKKANEGSLGNRIVHALIAAAEFLPIISQIASIFEKIIVENFSSKIVIEHFTSEPAKTEPKQHVTQTQNSSNNNANVSFKKYKRNLRYNLAETIKNQQNSRTYKKTTPLATLDEKQHGTLPISLSSIPKKVSHFSENATFYGYNAECIRDYGWGCAWRAIQTTLSAYQINPSFEELFHLFGPFENLKQIYENKYPGKQLSNSKLFAPYDLTSGWAEPFIGHMVMHFYDKPSTLETVNGIPDCHAPHEVFHHNTLNFEFFKQGLEAHFNTENPAPIMIDDGTYTLNIVGVETEGVNTILWIADPHIKEGVNKVMDKDKSPAGLYTVTLNQVGKQIDCSLDNVDSHHVSSMFDERTYKELHFDSKSWMVLFPSLVMEKIRRISLDDVERMEVDKPSKEGSSNTSSARVILKDGREATISEIDAIYSIAASIEPEKVNPGREWRAEEVLEHYDKHRSLGSLMGQYISSTAVLNIIFYPSNEHSNNEEFE